MHDKRTSYNNIWAHAPEMKERRPDKYEYS